MLSAAGRNGSCQSEHYPGKRRAVEAEKERVQLKMLIGPYCKQVLAICSYTRLSKIQNSTNELLRVAKSHGQHDKLGKEIVK